MTNHAEALAKALEALRLKFTSGNEHPVTVARITREEYAALTERIVELESIASSAKNERQLWEENFNRVEAERDALRAALLGALEHWPVPSSICKDRQAWLNARAAIDNERSEA